MAEVFLFFEANVRAFGVGIGRSVIILSIVVVVIVRVVFTVIIVVATATVTINFVWKKESSAGGKRLSRKLIDLSVSCFYQKISIS